MEFRLADYVNGYIKQNPILKYDHADESNFHYSSTRENLILYSLVVPSTGYETEFDFFFNETLSEVQQNCLNHFRNNGYNLRREEGRNPFLEGNPTEISHSCTLTLDNETKAKSLLDTIAGFNQYFPK